MASDCHQGLGENTGGQAVGMGAVPGHQIPYLPFTLSNVHALYRPLWTRACMTKMDHKPASPPQGRESSCLYQLELPMPPNNKYSLSGKSLTNAKPFICAISASDPSSHLSQSLVSKEAEPRTDEVLLTELANNKVKVSTWKLCPRPLGIGRIMTPPKMSVS